MNEMIPEEQDPQYEEVIALLRRVNLNPLFVDSKERTQVISQARARLFHTEPEGSKYEDIPTSKMRGLGSLPSKSKGRRDKQIGSGRLTHLLNVLAAVLVVAVLIGSALLIFGPWSPLLKDRSGTAPPIGPVGAPVVVSTQSHGLEMTMKITSGPYFLSELLEVDISLTNHTQTTFQGDMCHLSPKLIVIDGEGLRDTSLASAVAKTINSAQYLGVRIFPHDTNLATALATIYTPTNSSECIPDQFNLMQLQPTKTITVQHYVALTSSGHVTFTARASFQRAVPGQNSRVTLVTAANPLDGHWPSLQISVSTQVPSDRMLALHQLTTQAIVDVPLAARSHLLYAFEYSCGLGSIASEFGGEFRVGNRMDNKISQPTITLQRPLCGNSKYKIFSWTYVVGAIGYTTLAGKYSY
jgi:hypothetical protein